MLKIKYPMLQKCVYFSEGAGSQYKNYKALSNLCHHESDSGLKAEWNFFPTYHGKNPYDGIGGTIKHSHVSRDSHCRLWFRRKVGTLGWHCLEQEVSIGISLAVKYSFKCIMSHLMM